MRRVLKYPFKERGLTLHIPADAKLVLCDTQGNNHNPVLWFEIDDEKPTAQRFFHFWGTGMEIDECPAYEQWRHLASCQHEGFGLVWHVYELRDEREP